MKKSNCKSSGRCGQLLPLPARMGGPGHEVCHSPESHSVLLGISMTLSPWGFSLVPSHHGLAACPGQWQWVRLNHTKPPEKGLLSSCIQPGFLWGIGSSPWCYSKVSLLLCGVTRQFMGSVLPSCNELWHRDTLVGPFFSEQWQQTLNVLRTWKGHRILADDLIDHTPSLPPCRLHFHT